MATSSPSPSPTNPFHMIKTPSNSIAQIFFTLLLFLFFSFLSILSTAAGSPEAEIHLACRATRYPELCFSSLNQSNSLHPNPTPVQIIRSAIRVSSESLKTAESMLRAIVASPTSDRNLTRLAETCLEIFRYSHHRISSSKRSLRNRRGRDDVKNARAWMSAALSYQSDCNGGLKYIGSNTALANQTMSFLDTLIGYTSNALSMMVSYDIFGDETASWRPPKTERDGFWEKPETDSEGGLRAVGFPSNLTANVTVCKDGRNGCYKTVQDAVDTAPDYPVGGKRFVIYIKEGVYEETVRVPFEKKNVVFLGDGKGKTVITGSLNSGQPGVTTYESATVGVLGDGFMARGLTIQNTAGPPTFQAVAFRSDSDLSIVENCEFIGHQDTLYTHSLRQYYRSCRILGNVDFIFGNSAAIFQDCEILVNPRQENPEKGESNAVAAHGRTDPAQSTGFVFQNCLINGTGEYMKLYNSNPTVHRSYLGRPWKEYSRTVFIRCEMEALINPQGWMPWNGDFALKTLYYGEYENAGPGSNLSQRVPWSSQISPDHLYTYSLHNFIQGYEWNLSFS